MRTSFQSFILAAIAISSLHGVLAANVPQNVKNLYNALKQGGKCKNVLQGGFAAAEGGPKTFSYCGDHLKDLGIIYIQGTKGKLADMDIDCDGSTKGPSNDSRCDPLGDRQTTTAFGDTIRKYHVGIKELNPFIHPYVVFGNDNENNKPGFVKFDPQKYGIKPLSLMAVVCGEKLIYGIWGDTNGADGTCSVVGEASISLATACFGKSMTANNGHDAADVLYLAFTGDKAVPGPRGAAWRAKSYAEFGESVRALGDRLVGSI